MGEKELKPTTLEDEIKEIRQQMGGLLKLCIPPKEVVDEVKKEFITAQVSILKIFKTLLDYQIKTLEEFAQGKPTKPKKGKVQKIKVE